MTDAQHFSSRSRGQLGDMAIRFARQAHQSDLSRFDYGHVYTAPVHPPLAHPALNPTCMLHTSSMASFLRLPPDLFLSSLLIRIRGAGIFLSHSVTAHGGSMLGPGVNMALFRSRSACACVLACPTGQRRQSISILKPHSAHPAFVLSISRWPKWLL